MANVTDPLIRAVQGSDPQNLMEYITRQKIYDSRFWKEECFGLTAADVLEKAAKSLTCIGGTMGANQKPTKFLCLTLKLLQLQPESELIQEDFIQQPHFKYVRALGVFYLRLTGRPADIYNSLEPLYKDYSKLKTRETSEWQLTFMDQIIHDLLTQPYFVGITLPRLPARETLQQEGYLEDGPRKTALEDVILKAGGLEDYLNYKANVEKSPAAIALWNERTGEPNTGKTKTHSTKTQIKEVRSDDDDEEEVGEVPQEPGKRKSSSHKDDDGTKKKKHKKTKNDKGYGTLFKKDQCTKVSSIPKDKGGKVPEEGSEEYWNEERIKLGLKPLYKK